MDYEKKYNEALKLAESYYGDGANEFLDTIFPELAESEDERIRKELVAVLEDLILPADQRKRFLSYLEKQKINTEGDFGRGYDCGYEACLNSHGAEWFEKQKEQKSVEPSDDELQRHQDELHNFKVFAAKQAKEYHISFVHDFEWNNFCAGLLSYFNEKQKPADYNEYKMLIEGARENGKIEGRKEVIDHPDEYGLSKQKPAEWSPTKEQMVALSWAANGMLDNDFPSAGDIKASLRSLYNDLQSKSIKFAEWSEEDKEIIETICKEGDLTPSEVRWLKSLPERFNIQSKQEWSEEDEKDMAHIIRILDDCYAYGKHDLSKTDHENLVGTLKSLRPQSKAEWSEEDEKNLENIRIYLLHHEEDAWADTITKLKSLRPSWKPSEEHLSALLAIFNDPDNIGSQTCQLALSNLYEQLKKLM